MTRCHFTRSNRRIAGPLVLLLFAISAVPLHAQLVAKSKTFYDVTQEVTLSGTLSNVLSQPTRGMMLGAHLLLATPSGNVDASLGRWGLQGKGAPSLVPGQEVAVTGIMMTRLNKPVFVVRSVKVDGQVYQMRNQYGIPVSPQARERASHKAGQKGDQL